MIMLSYEKVVWVDSSPFCPAAVSLVALSIGNVDARWRGPLEEPRFGF